MQENRDKKAVRQNRKQQNWEVSHTLLIITLNRSGLNSPMRGRPNWKYPKCLSTDEWTNSMHTYPVEYYSALKGIICWPTLQCWKRYAKWKKADTESYRLYDSIYMKHLVSPYDCGYVWVFSHFIFSLYHALSGYPNLFSWLLLDLSKFSLSPPPQIWKLFVLF